jgi:PhzF family phenazine biosynthesis protein
MPRLNFRTVDVFTAVPFKGNPLAVLIGADDLSDAQMAQIANWTNLSETTFLCKPTDPKADYRLRIFTPARELPFAGHPTLGTCQVWLDQGGKPKGQEIVQQCQAGLVRIKRSDNRLAFAAPPLVKSGAVEPELLEQIAKSLGLTVGDIKASQYIDNGPGWIGVMIGSRAQLLGLKCDYAILGKRALGVVAPCDKQRDKIDAQFELRAFAGFLGIEDPVTGSLNASVGQWLIGAGIAPPTYVAAQGTALGRDGRIYVSKQGNDVWIGGDTVTCVEGTIAF